ncbi:hypothetical protein Q1695_015218 [Nippostrongylus brasiliensis]|nr:hypothetical protein Q1695_015218 [Nippostrongylus brasiliensis]
MEAFGHPSQCYSTSYLIWDIYVSERRVDERVSVLVVGLTGYGYPECLGDSGLASHSPVPSSLVQRPAAPTRRAPSARPGEKVAQPATERGSICRQFIAITSSATGQPGFSYARSATKAFCQMNANLEQRKCNRLH